MDSALLKAMLDSQERAYKTAMDVVVKQLNDQISKLDGKVDDLTKSLEFTQQEVDELKANIKENGKERSEDKYKIQNLTEQLESSHDKIKELENRVNLQEDYSRRNNIRISGMDEMGDGETWEQTAAEVTSLIEEKMQIPGILLERAHRVGQRRDAKPRPIVARFTRHCDRENVMRNARKLKGTNIFMNDDLCAASQAVKNAQMPQFKQARAQGKIAFFRHTRLIIKDKQDAAGQRQSPERGVSAVRGGMSGGCDGARHEPVAAAAAAGAASASVGDGGGAAAAAGGADTAAGGGASAAANGAAAAAAAAAAGGVVATEVAGAWSSKRDESFPSLPKPRTDLRSQSPSAPAGTPQQRQVGKKGLRSSAKK